MPKPLYRRLIDQDPISDIEFAIIIMIFIALANFIIWMKVIL